MSKTQETAVLPVKEVVIKPPNFKFGVFKLIGTTPYVQNAFSEKAKQKMIETQKAGTQATKKRTKEPKDFIECYENSKHISREGWAGIPAGAFRAAMVSACRLVQFKMTIGKLTVFVLQDGFDAKDGTPLVKITKGEPHYVEHLVRLDSGTADVRARAMWDEGWEAIVKMKYDGDFFTFDDVTNLLWRVGEQIGVGEGRPDSKDSVGMGWGLFRIEGKPLDKLPGEIRGKG